MLRTEIEATAYPIEQLESRVCADPAATYDPKNREACASHLSAATDALHEPYSGSRIQMVLVDLLLIRQ